MLNEYCQQKEDNCDANQRQLSTHVVFVMMMMVLLRATLMLVMMMMTV